MHPEENKNCYATAAQRTVLVKLLAFLDRNIFLTGGTALSVFYLHHRLSNDLDFFCENMDLDDIKSKIKGIWPNAHVQNESKTFLTMNPEEVKVDFVIDKLTAMPALERPIVMIEDQALLLDAFGNILSNKLATLVSRGEPKDVIDFHFAWKKGLFKEDEVYAGAVRKEGLFDDPPSAAYAISDNLDKLQRGPVDWPQMLIPFEPEEAFATVKEWIDWLLEKGREDAGLP